MARASPRKETPWHWETRHRRDCLREAPWRCGTLRASRATPLCVQGVEAQQRSPAKGLTGLPRSMRKAVLGHRGAESCLGLGTRHRDNSIREERLKEEAPLRATSRGASGER